MKRNRTEWWKITLPVGIGAAVYLAYRSRARAAVTTHEHVYTDPETGETRPLRPVPQPSGMPPPGPLASEVREFIEDLTDEQLEDLRQALPSRWWDDIHDAVMEPTDEGVVTVFEPMVDDFSEMTEEEQGTMQTDVISAIGIINGYQLNDLLKRAGVIPS